MVRHHVAMLGDIAYPEEWEPKPAPVVLARAPSLRTLQVLPTNLIDLFPSVFLPTSITLSPSHSASPSSSAYPTSIGGFFSPTCSICQMHTYSPSNSDYGPDVTYYDDDVSRSIDSDSIISIVFSVFFCVGFISCFFFKSKNNQEASPVTTTTQVITATAPVATQTSDFVRNATNEPKMSKEDRCEYVTNALNAKKYHQWTDRSTCGGSSLSIDEEDLEMMMMQREKSVRSCAICLEPFRQEDEVCTSNNPNCQHMFHRHEIYEWLLDHDHCPCCRRPYLDFCD